MPTKLLAIATAALLLAGCPETLGPQCPSNTTPIGLYALNLSVQHDAGECVVTQIDGGPADASLAADDAGQRGVTFCATSTGGGYDLTMVVSGQSLQKTAHLEGDGSFQFFTDAGPTPFTECNCSPTLSEAFAGQLLLPADAGFAILPDGGLPLVVGVAGSIHDRLSDGTPACTCNIPCDVWYSVAGTRQ
jgi:hypothetical protein